MRKGSFTGWKGRGMDPSANDPPQGASAIAASMSSLSISSTGSAAAAAPLWPAEKAAYTPGAEIGQGATSLVFEATCSVMGNAKCALKVINLERCSSSASLDEINKEINAGKKLKHENIVQYYTSFLHDTHLYIVMELAPRGSLHDYLKYISTKRGLANGALDENVIATILKDSLRGLIYIHDNNLIHRDIKCGNLLVKADGTVQIADFGVAGAIQHSFDVRHTFVGTPCWMAPEIMMIVLRAQKLWQEEQETRGGAQLGAQGYNQKADIWSLGITTLELAIGRAPLAEAQPLKILLTTVTSDPPSLESVESRSKVPLNYSAYGQKYRKFVRSCLNHDPNKRSAAKELLNHSFIKSKGKDREFLLRTLFTSGDVAPMPMARSQHGRRHVALDRVSAGAEQLPSSGEWDFNVNIADSDSDDDNSETGPAPASASPAHRPAGAEAGATAAPSATAAVSGSSASAAAAAAAAVTAPPVPMPVPVPVTMMPPVMPVELPPGMPLGAVPVAYPVPVPLPLPVLSAPVEQAESGPLMPYLMQLPPDTEIFPLTYKLTLRKRFPKKDNSGETELRDVSFLFEPARDVAETMARDLVEANLLSGKDYLLMAYNIDKIVRHPTSCNPHTWALNSGPLPPNQVSEPDLHGYVRISLKLPSVEEMRTKRAQEDARMQQQLLQQQHHQQHNVQQPPQPPPEQ